MLHRLPSLLVLAVVACCMAVSCATHAGQLTASEIYPNVRLVTEDLEAYLDAGLAPDGSRLTPDEVFERRGPLIALRNACHVAMGEPLEPLPRLEPAPAPEPKDDDDSDAGEDGAGPAVR